MGAEKVACIIPAAGWGSVCQVRSIAKVVEPVGNERMINRVVETVRSARLNGRVVVVVGDNKYGSQIRECLAEDRDVVFAVQPRRRGAADAVACGLPYLDDERHVMVTFGDMPLWRPQTLQNLALAHLKHGRATISMITLRLPSEHRFERYGRIARDEQSRILGAFEPSELAGQKLPEVAFVNPSLYVFDRSWLTANLSLIPPVDKGDGFGPELHLPKLLFIAHDQGVTIQEIRLTDKSEALGVNTAEELAEVQEILRSRMATVA